MKYLNLISSVDTNITKVAKSNNNKKRNEFVRK